MRGELPPRVMFLVRSFDRGGAERQLVTLLLGLQRRGWPVSVACFYAGGPLQADLDVVGVPVFDLRKHGRWDVLGFLWRLGRQVRKTRPTILHGYLPVPNVLAVLLRFLNPGMKVVWGVRASNMDLSRYDLLSRFSYGFESRCSRWADLVISNSEAGAQTRIAQGFPAATMRVIPNGIDTERFRFDAAGRERLRQEWGVSDTAVLVGLVGRLDPMKDHSTFLKAAALLSSRNPIWHFVCVGDGPVGYREELVALAAELGLEERLSWAGSRDDMAAVYSALDIASSSSYGEGFSNVVAEAMACGRPCVVTDVGDSARIVGNTGIVVPPRDPPALAAGIERLQVRLETEDETLRKAACVRIKQEFGMAALTERTASALQELFEAT